MLKLLIGMLATSVFMGVLAGFLYLMIFKIPIEIGIVIVALILFAPLFYEVGTYITEEWME